jgi:zinc transport system ATP-binding protein
LNDPVLVVQGLTVYRGDASSGAGGVLYRASGHRYRNYWPQWRGQKHPDSGGAGHFAPPGGADFGAGIIALSAKGYLPPAVRQQIAYLPQNFLFDRRIPITVSELVGLGWDRVGPQLPWVGGRARRQAVRAALAR